jgi:hypothetical protein
MDRLERSIEKINTRLDKMAWSVVAGIGTGLISLIVGLVLVFVSRAK